MTFVQDLVSKGRAAFGARAGAIELLFENPQARGALRLVLIGLAVGHGDDANWGHLQKDLVKLFSFPKGESPNFNANLVRRFALALRDQRLENLHAYLSMLACHLLKDTPNLRQARPVIDDALQLFDFAEAIERYLTADDPAALGVTKSGAAGIRTINRLIRQALSIERSDIRKVSRHFFQRADRSDDLLFKDQSYYLAYRYSTMRTEIVKTFLVINSPKYNDVESFSFTHIYHVQRGNVSRISRGAVVGFDHAFYFIGASARLLPNRSMDKTQGVKVIAIPIESFAHEHRLLAGVFLATGLNWQPLVGRIALVHLGFEQTIGQISEEEARPKMLRTETELHSDLMEELNLPNFPADNAHVEECFAFIIERINNRPYVDRTEDLATEGIRRALTAEELGDPRD